MRTPPLGTLSLLVGLLALAISVGLPARAASVLVFAQHARNAGAVDGSSAAKRPKPGVLLATGRQARFPRTVFRSPPAGAQGSRGPAGAGGPVGRGGPLGLQGARGLPGAAGAVGLQGALGAIGARGVDGVRGAAGPTGPNGELVPTSAGGVLTGFFPSPLLATGAVGQASIATSTIVAADLAPSLSNAPSASLRALGTGPLQAASGSDPRLSDSRVPRGPAGGDLTGSYPGPTIQTGAVTAAGLGGDSRLWAAVSAAGDLLRGHGAVDAMTILTPGEYHVDFDRAVTGCVAAATVNAGAATSVTVASASDPRAVIVVVRTPTNPFAFVPQPFTVRLFC